MAMGWGANMVGEVATVFGRDGEVTAQPGDYSSEKISDASGAGGATVQASLDALAPTVFESNGFDLGVAPLYTTLLTLPLAEGRTYTLRGEIELQRSSPLESSIIALTTTARRAVGGSAEVSTPVLTVNGSITGLQAAWVAEGNDVELRVQSLLGVTVDVTGRYFWREKIVT